MTKRALPVEAVLLLSIAAIWALLAAIYQFSPSLGMPGYVRVWGAGAVVFVGLAVPFIVKSRRRG
jgi:hypothetical protein